MRPREQDAGFTLVEMLVALALFAMIAVAGVTLLGSSVRGQEAQRRHLDQTDQVARLAHMLALDLGQAVEGGFVAEAARLRFTRAGPPRGVEAVDLRLEDGALVRQASASAPRTVLLEGVSRVDMRLRRKGEWQAVGRATTSNLPDALELVLGRAGQPDLRLIFPVGVRQP